MNSERGFLHFGILTSLVAVSLVVAGAFFLSRTQGAPEAEVPQAIAEEALLAPNNFTGAEKPADSAPPAALGAEKQPTEKPVYAYIVAIENGTIVLDYLEPLYGEDALKAMIADGHCKQGDMLDQCFQSVPLYDRNVNPMLRTFVLAPDVQIFSDREDVLTLENLKGYGLAFELDGRRYGRFFTISFNDKKEVSKIEGVFRP